MKKTQESDEGASVWRHRRSSAPSPMSPSNVGVVASELAGDHRLSDGVCKSESLGRDCSCAFKEKEEDPSRARKITQRETGQATTADCLVTDRFFKYHLGFLPPLAPPLYPSNIGEETGKLFGLAFCA